MSYALFEWALSSGFTVMPEEYQIKVSEVLIRLDPPRSKSIRKVVVCNAEEGNESD